MHNNYYCLLPLSRTLHQRLQGFTLVSCFSQFRDELVMEFNNSQSSFFIKVTLGQELQCLSFPNSFHRARKNSVDLFNGLLMKAVKGVRCFNNERSIALELEGDHTVVFKMHGLQANVIWFSGDVVEDLFQQRIENDRALKLGQLDRGIDWSREYFDRHQSDLHASYFTFGKRVLKYLDGKGYSTATVDARWKMLTEVRAELENPQFRIIDTEQGIGLTLLPGEALRTFADPIEALSDFFYARTSTESLGKEKGQLLSALRKKRSQAQAYIDKCREKLNGLDSRESFSQRGDLIMANMQHIPVGASKVVLDNFYKDNTPIEIKLNPELSPQKNAEVYYRKSRNQQIEIKKIEESMGTKAAEVAQLDQQIATVESTEDLNAVRQLAGAHQKVVAAKVTTLPYREYTFKGFVIRVGRNAEANDELTQRFAHKDDLWLHAKDVSGSHVVVVHHAGHPFPKDVIAYAAGLAAYHSKRKNESLCPVAYTLKKYVRKRKGDPAGAVVVEREEVILAEPISGV